MNFTCASFAYPRLNTAERSSVARTLDYLDIPGIFVLSTCLRIELVAPDSPAQLTEKLAAAGFGRELPKAEITSDEDAAHHLFRVAAGLESPVVGEKEILSQYRSAVTDTASTSKNGPFIKLLQAGVGIGRKAREALPPLPHDSMGMVAADLIADSEQITIIGAGEMATAVVRGLRQKPNHPHIVLLARQPDKVAIDGVEVWPLSRLDEVLGHHTTVVSATSAATRLMSQRHLTQLLASRTEPLTIVDMALPPDFDPPPGSAVTYFDIDDLALKARTQIDVFEADALVETATATAFRRYATHQTLGPMIGRMVEEADTIVDSAVARFGPKLTAASDVQLLRQVAHTVARSLLSRPIAHLRDAETQTDIQLIAEAFINSDD